MFFKTPYVNNDVNKTHLGQFCDFMKVLIYQELLGNLNF